LILKTRPSKIMSHTTKAFWAPCVHSDEDAAKVKPWLKQVIETSECISVEDPDPREDSVLEDILAVIALKYSGNGASCLRDINFRFDADQWVGVEVEMTLHDGSTQRLSIQGDNFLLAMAKALEYLNDLAKTQKQNSQGGSPDTSASAEQ
jgi:hypothetical protein